MVIEVTATERVGTMNADVQASAPNNQSQGGETGQLTMVDLRPCGPGS